MSDKAHGLWRKINFVLKTNDRTCDNAEDCSVCYRVLYAFTIKHVSDFFDADT